MATTYRRVIRISVIALCFATILIPTGCSTPDRVPTEQLIDRLKSVDARNRKPAVDALAARGNEVVPLLLEEMSSSYTQVRFEVAHLLGRIRDRRAVPALIKALGDKSTNVAQTAAWSLGSIRDSGAVTALLAYADDLSPGVRKQVVWALGACHSDTLAAALTDSAYGVIVRALADDKAQVREGAVLGLREYGLRNAVDLVIPMGEDPSPEIRYLVVQLLDQLQAGGYARTVGALSSDQRVRIVIALIDLLDDDHASIRTDAIRALGRCADARALAPLAQLRDTGSDTDRVEAAQAFARLERMLSRQP